jgi:TP901 family phage tail tape measure protein
LSNNISKASEEQTRNADATYKALAAQRNYDSEFERIKYHIKYLLSITNAWRQVRNIITQTYEDVSKLDKAFAEIAMVTNHSVSDMWEQYSNYAQMANKLGQTTESVIQASGLYYQQGLDTAEALKLTEDTMKLATLAGLDFKDATSQMTAALRAFHMEMDQGSHVTDVYAEVAANAAVDVQGLSDAMSATAAIANSSGMAFETTTAMLATMVEAT